MTAGWHGSDARYGIVQYIAIEKFVLEKILQFRLCLLDFCLGCSIYDLSAVERNFRPPSSLSLSSFELRSSFVFSVDILIYHTETKILDSSSSLHAYFSSGSVFS